jgi:hypothetical protein
VIGKSGAPLLPITRGFVSGSHDLKRELEAEPGKIGPPRAHAFLHVFLHVFLQFLAIV